MVGTPTAIRSPPCPTVIELVRRSSKHLGRPSTWSQGHLDAVLVTLRSLYSPDQDRVGTPRARAGRTKRDRTRRALLDATDAASGSRGWPVSRMEDIATAAGVSAATAHDHFPSTHALLGHLRPPLVRNLVVQAELDILAGRPVVESLHAQVTTLGRSSSRSRGPTTALWSAVQDYTIRVAGPPADDDQQDPRTPAPVPPALRLLIEHGQGTGRLRAFPSASDMTGIIVNLVLVRSIDRPNEAPAVTVELLLTVISGALDPNSAPRAESTNDRSAEAIGGIAPTCCRPGHRQQRRAVVLVGRTALLSRARPARPRGRRRRSRARRG